MKRILVATRSAHKLREIREIFSTGPGVDLLDLQDAGIAYAPEEEEIEAFDTFEENALAKARYFAALSGLPVLADDSGLCVDALGGEPGVRSKRFAGLAAEGDSDRANNLHLLQRLEGVSSERRGAHYRCVLALVQPDGTERLFDGRCEGLILSRPRGDGGFGYDPLFLVPEDGRTFAEMSADEKNAISHRSRALRAAARALADDGSPT
jgi:XTP/dITP diphosphohydrolase